MEDARQAAGGVRAGLTSCRGKSARNSASYRDAPRTNGIVAPRAPARNVTLGAPDHRRRTGSRSRRRLAPYHFCNAKGLANNSADEPGVIDVIRVQSLALRSVSSPLAFNSSTKIAQRAHRESSAQSSDPYIVLSADIQYYIWCVHTIMIG
jgi:hypothetical protein